MKHYIRRVSFVLMGFLALSKGLSQPLANFRATVVAGCAPMIITFEDQSSGAVAWEWHTGVGQSHLQHPAVFYTTPGTYTVTLIVTDAQGAKDTLRRTDYITAYASPIANFQVNSSLICAGEAVVFTDLSQAGGGGALAYAWDFGDGQSSTAAQPSHVYAQQGLFPVSLIVRNTFGCTDNKVIPSAVTVSAPDVSFSADNRLACGPPLTVQFTAGNANGIHFWDFGDGATSSLPNPTHTFTQTGSFDVKHVVSSSQGCKDSLVKAAFINIGVNTLGISARDSTVCEGDTVFFQTNAPANATVIWNFGNGVTQLQHQPYYIYQAAGTYQVSAQISDPSGCSYAMSFPVTIFPKPAVAFTVNGSPTGCQLPFTVQFVNQSQHAVSWNWRFGDGKTSNLEHPTHTYTQEGSFDIRLAVTGLNGCALAQSFKAYIEVRELKARFKADNRSGCAPLTVQFTDTAQPIFPITSWQWDFGDGNTSTLPNPIHSYSVPGVYTVRLIVANAQGCRDTLIRTDYISAGIKPGVNFAPSANQACALSQVEFTNLSTGAHSFLWIFGDGDTAMSYHASHGFAALGPMSVMLIGYDRGCADTLFMPNAVNVLAPLPIMGITEKRICNLPATVGFFNLSIGADTYEWTLNGAPFSTLPHPTFTFTQAGNYSVGLTVSNAATGCTVTAYDMVQALPVEANFTPSPSQGCHPLPVAFQNTSTHAVRSWWHFGLAPKDTSIQTNPVFNYALPGNYTVTLIVTNILKCKDTLTVVHAVQAHGVKADFSTQTPRAGCLPLAVSFQDLSTATGPVVSWLWDFGDGNTSTAQHPTHVYQTPGNYTVKLTTTHASGCSHTLTRTNFVNATFPSADFLVTSPISCPDQLVTFVSKSMGSGLIYHWEFGDGATGFLANPTHAYAAPGDYTVRLKVTDVNGCVDSIEKTNLVAIRPLVAAFTADTTHAACPPLPVRFTPDPSQVHPGATWSWSFGNGATSGQQHPFHQYTQPGLYDVRLVVTSPSGCTDTAFAPELIQVEGPVASFAFDPGIGCPGTEFQFEAQSEVVIKYQWYFGDGGTAFGSQASYMYPSSGVYQPALLVEDSSGCKVFTQAEDSIRVFSVPAPSFSSDRRLLCESGEIQFSDGTAVADPTGYSWFWDFGDGVISTARNPVHTCAHPGLFTVSLRITTPDGCMDSLVRTAWIEVVKRPMPEVAVSDTSGCVPFGVTFQARVDDHVAPISNYQWDFGESGAQGSGVQVSHVYQLGNTYLATLSVTDQNGCVGTVNQVVEAWSLPSGSFTASDTVGCAPASISFTANVPHALAWQWTFGDGAFSGSNPATHTYLQDGIFEVTLEVADSNGCKAALAKSPFIRLRHPEARFEPKGEACPETLVEFSHQSVFEQGLQSVEWKFGDGVQLSGDSVQRVFTPAGTYSATLIISDLLNCTDTLRIDPAVTVIHSQLPDPVSLDFATVESATEVRLGFSPYQSPWGDFSRYVVYRLNPVGAYDSVGTVVSPYVNEFADPASRPEEKAECYKVQMVNICGLRSDLVQTDPHCTMDIQPEPLPDAVLVAWTPYEGFSPESYRVYRVTGYGSGGELIGVTPGSETTFIDDRTQCEQTYAYRVEAVGASRAWSDMGKAAPVHEGPSEAVHLVRATVEANTQVLAEWELPPLDKADRLVLERNEGRGYQTVWTGPYANTSVKFTDLEAAIAERSYAYRVLAIDSCGEVTPLGRTGKTMLLLADQKGGAIELQWTPYEGWQHGVARYVVEAFDLETQTFIPIGDSEALAFKDMEQRSGQGDKCYRVTAYERGGNGVFSRSNEACVMPRPTVFAANAFTPNGDGINDVFVLQGAYLEGAEIRIFSRWGEEIFFSRQPFEGWNGVTDKGMQAPEGVYVYVLSGLGDNGDPVKLLGSITLIR